MIDKGTKRTAYPVTVTRSRNLVVTKPPGEDDALPEVLAAARAALRPGERIVVISPTRIDLVPLPH